MLDHREHLGPSSGFAVVVGKGTPGQISSIRAWTRLAWARGRRSDARFQLSSPFVASSSDKMAGRQTRRRQGLS
jgi:hypothetical protein